jgi:hypothetical protein
LFVCFLLKRAFSGTHIEADVTKYINPLKESRTNLEQSNFFCVPEVLKRRLETRGDAAVTLTNIKTLSATEATLAEWLLSFCTQSSSILSRTSLKKG